MESKLEKMFKQLEDIENLLRKEQLEAIAEKIFQKLVLKLNKNLFYLLTLAKDNWLNDNKLKKEVTKITKKNRTKAYETLDNFNETNIASSSKLKKSKYEDYKKSEKEKKKKKKKKKKLKSIKKGKKQKIL